MRVDLESAAIGEIAAEHYEQQRLEGLIDNIDAVRIYKHIIGKVVGQDILAALIANKVSDSLLLEKKGKPRCSLFLSGAAGLGKTYMGEVTAEAAYPGVPEPSRIIALGEASSASALAMKIRGSGSMWTGGRKEGDLIGYLKANAATGGVIIFDEIDKALRDFPDQQNLFLELLDRGRVSHEDGDIHYLDKFMVFFAANAAADEFTDKAKELYPKHSVEIDTERQRPVLVPRNREISKPFEQLLLDEGILKEPFTRRLDLIAGMLRPSGDESIRLAQVILSKTLRSHFTSMDEFYDPNLESLVGKKVVPWLTSRINDENIGTSRAEREYLGLVEEQLADILRARITRGLARKFPPRLRWDEANECPLLADAEAPYD